MSLFTSPLKDDAIGSADDCRRNFVARCLFRKLTERWASFDKGPFKLWCDEIRLANVLLSKDLKIAAVVDWEFTLPPLLNSPTRHLGGF
ncbi:hypothetical protein N7447_009747 [Penicillium robsamsonii]|uniref:uncharacterized protein n=1 Tax=Penicillium robsamsonii TaxID=1792511 RepID=UPI00254870FE|nr:uncharacterized protein N7447_009747 [Penicillium robsamsonii]KAJ5812724.1 hypothetical protein N7447_009747 [Penicillium robsamsonii]